MCDMNRTSQHEKKTENCVVCMSQSVSIARLAVIENSSGAAAPTTSERSMNEETQANKNRHGTKIT